MSNLSLERLKFDPTDVAEGPKVGSYIVSSAGEVITHTDDGLKNRLDVDATLSGLDQPAEFGIYAEDSVHNSGDKGSFSLAVQTASQGPLANDGDYAPFQVDSQGRLRVITDIDLTGDLVNDDAVDTEDPIKGGHHAYNQAVALGTVDAGDKANSASDRYRRMFINDAPNVNLQTSVTACSDVEAELASTPMAGRTRMLIQNQGAKSIFVGATGVTDITGIEIAKGDSMTLEIGEAVNIFAICKTGETSSARVLEWG